ncbi:hypothetical protein MKW94_005526 [Papaver nudicaule]|uniref:Uncharacterized protein n=1 Tax=Papaver nudicaule TaxID=74823 RepID=A0AA41S5Y1_PAPNU|nr:hypothetical protein [Papaver nudicaule]
MFFRHISISVPLDSLEWQISQDTANTIIATLANTLGAAESVLRVAATGHDKRLFVKIHFDVSGRISGAAVRSYLLERYTLSNTFCVFLKEAIFRTLAVILHLGNIEFSPGKENDSSTTKDKKSRFHLQMAAELFM